jgi:uncharacterized protein DUF4260
MSASARAQAPTAERTKAGDGSWTDRVGGHVRLFLRADALATLIAGAVAYAMLGGPWLLLVPLVLVPDVTMVGYLRDARLGSLTYNLGHNLATAGVALGVGVWLGIGWLAVAGTILVVHIGMDRALGYGLKYPTVFKDTHLQHV